MKKLLLILFFLSLNSHSKLSALQIKEAKNELAKQGITCNKFNYENSSDNKINKNFNVVINENKYNVLPLFKGAEINCYKSYIPNDGNINISIYELGNYNGVKYSIHYDGSGSLDLSVKTKKIGDYQYDENVHKWSSVCVVDPMTDDGYCYIHDLTNNLFIYKGKSGYSIQIGMGDHYPGKTSFIRVNKNAPLSTQDKYGRLNQIDSGKFIQEVNNGDTVVTRFVKWPYESNIDTKIDTTHIVEYIAILDKLYEKLSSN